MTNRPQILRSSTPGQVPAAGSRLAGELWTTFPDLQLGVIDASKNAQKLIAVRYFSTSANYATGDFVIQAGALYVAKGAITAGAFNGTQWTKVAAATDPDGPHLPLAGGTVTGVLTLNNSSAPVSQFVINDPSTPLTSTGYGAWISGQRTNKPRWIMALGNGAAESGANVGSDFFLYAYADDGVTTISPTPITINRKTSLVTIPNLSAPYLPIGGGTLTGPLTLSGTPSVPLHAATKAYVDSLSGGGQNTGLNDNRIINGDMAIDQRNAGNPGTAANSYTVDRWQYGGLASKGNWQRWPNGQSDMAVTGTTWSWKFASTSAYVPVSTASFTLSQPIEADMISDFAWGGSGAKAVTLSAWVYTSLTGTFGGSVMNFAATRSYPFTFSVPAANTWTRVVINIPGDTAGTWVMGGNAGAMWVNFDLGSHAGMRGPAGAWAAAGYNGASGCVNTISTNGATFYVTAVKLEIGSVATPFPRQSLAKCLIDCQRYFFKPASPVWTSGYAPTAAGLSIFAARTFPVTMRAVPTQAGATFAPVNCNTINMQSIGVEGSIFTCTNTAIGAFQFSINSGTETYSAEY